MFLLQSSSLHSSNAVEGGSHYKFRSEHPVLQYLPTKWAEFIGDNYAEELGLQVSDLKQGDKWTVAGLNHILQHLVGDLKVFGAIEMESDICVGRPQIRCYPFKSHTYHNANRQVTVA